MFFECWFWSTILIIFRLQVQDHEDKRKAQEVQLEVAEAEIVCLKRQLQEMEVLQE